MATTLTDTAFSIGDALLQNKTVKKGVETTLKGAVGIGAIGVGTALETVGTGTVIASAGSAITGAGCAATQALMTGAATVLPATLGTAVSGAIATTATTVFAVASSPVVLGGAAVAGILYGINKLVE